MEIKDNIEKLIDVHEKMLLSHLTLWQKLLYGEIKEKEKQRGTSLLRKIIPHYRAKRIMEGKL